MYSPPRVKSHAANYWRRLSFTALVPVSFVICFPTADMSACTTPMSNIFCKSLRGKIYLGCLDILFLSMTLEICPAADYKVYLSNIDSFGSRGGGGGVVIFIPLLHYWSIADGRRRPTINRHLLSFMGPARLPACLPACLSSPKTRFSSPLFFFFYSLSYLRSYHFSGELLANRVVN